MNMLKTQKLPDGTTIVYDHVGNVVGHFGDHASAAKFAGEKVEEEGEKQHEQELKEEKDMHAHDKSLSKGHAQHLGEQAQEEYDPEPEPVKRSHHKKV
jgi:hypothetical protein